MYVFFCTISLYNHCTISYIKALRLKPIQQCVYSVLKYNFSSVQIMKKFNEINKCRAKHDS